MTRAPRLLSLSVCSPLIWPPSSISTSSSPATSASLAVGKRSTGQGSRSSSASVVLTSTTWCRHGDEASVAAWNTAFGLIPLIHMLSSAERRPMVMPMRRRFIKLRGLVDRCGDPIQGLRDFCSTRHAPASVLALSHAERMGLRDR